MRLVHWLFVVSIALFVTGLGFVVAGARTARLAPAPNAAAAALTPVASVKQIMKGITGPAANAIFDAVQTSITIKGVEETAPHTDAEWEAVGNSAAAVIESGNLLLLGTRAVDKGDWTKTSQAMMEAGKAVLKATQQKNTEQVLASGEALNKSCDDCHRKYQRGA